MPRAAYALVLVGIAFGIWSEGVGPGLEQPRFWVPDLLAGLAILMAGVAGWTGRPASRVGPLLVLAAICWFAGNLTEPVLRAAWPNSLASAALAEALVASHRAPFAHALLGYPSGRLATRVERVAVAIAYATVVVASVWRFEPAALIVSTLVASVVFASYRRAFGQQRRSKLLAFRLASAVAAALATGVVLRSVLPPGLGAEPALLVYELALSGSAVLLAAGLARSASGEAAVADIVVDLGEDRSGTLRDALAEVLGDPSLGVGFRIGARDGYVDAGGRPFDVPEASFGRAITPIEREGEVVAVLVHDPAVLDEPALVDAVASAARLASRNAELQVEVRGQLADLRASRRRLVGAGDAERQRLARRLGDGALHRLDLLRQAVGAAISDVDPALESGQRMIRAHAQVIRAIAELHQLAQGLHPPELQEGGLVPALRELTEHSEVPVELDIPDDRLPSEIEAGIYFLCAEGLANAAKHANASRVVVTVRRLDARVIVELSDDGVGGADLGRGSGLRGLTDRIEALGGRLIVDSLPGGGTRLTAELSLGGQG